MRCPNNIVKEALGWTGELGKDEKGKFLMEYKAVADKNPGLKWKKIQKEPDYRGRFIYKRKNYEMSK